LEARRLLRIQEGSAPPAKPEDEAEKVDQSGKLKLIMVTTGTGHCTFTTLDFEV